jgi:5-methylcytosine-specific restriction endonuclease McrA
MKKDRKISKAISKRDDHTCIWCGQPGSDHAHIISRRFLFTRWLLENGLWMCRKCHLLFDSKTLVGIAFREHIIRHVITFFVYNKLCKVRDGKITAKEAGFTEIK